MKRNAIHTFCLFENESFVLDLQYLNAYMHCKPEYSVCHLPRLLISLSHQYAPSSILTPYYAPVSAQY